MIAYRKEIDGLRAVAVLVVILYHAGFRCAKGGFVGVDVFFVISGYLITSIILEDICNGQFKLKSFFERRVRRILPALYFVILASFPFAFLTLVPFQYRDFSQSVVATVVSASNVFFWLKTDYFDQVTELKPLIHTWSLGVEEQFYLIFPFFLLVLGKRNLRLYFGLAILLASSFLLACAVADKSPTAAFFLMPTRIWELTLGGISSLILRNKYEWVENLICRELLSAVGLSLVICSAIFIKPNIPYQGLFTLLPTLGAFLLIIFCTEGVVSHRILTFPVIVWLGLISYGAYLWHQPVFSFYKQIIQPELTLFSRLELIAATLVLSCLSYIFIERPFRDKKLFSAKTVYCILFSISGLLVAVSLPGAFGDGNLSRFNSDEMEVWGRQAERKSYVWERKNALNLVDFNANKKRNVLIVGDSFSADLVNILSEAGYDDNFSSIASNGKCLGPLTEYLINYQTSLPGECKSGWHESDRARILFDTADVILFVSYWKPQHFPSLMKYLPLLQNRFGSKIYLIGNKGVAVNFSYLARMTKGERVQAVAMPMASVVSSNKFLAENFPDIFFNISNVWCPQNECSLFDQNSHLITFDGSHLTREGAIYVGERLNKDGRLNGIIKKK